MEKSGGYTVLNCNLHFPLRVVPCFEPNTSFHPISCPPLHSAQPCRSGGWTSQERHSVFCINFILSVVVFLISPAHWPVVGLNLQDSWTLNILLVLFPAKCPLVIPFLGMPRFWEFGVYSNPPLSNYRHRMGVPISVYWHPMLDRGRGWCWRCLCI